MVLNTNNRAQALKVKAELAQRFPDQKVYFDYQAPNIKIKFGDFVSKDDAADYQSQIMDSKIVTGKVYIVPENIVVQPENSSKNQ